MKKLILSVLLCALFGPLYAQFNAPDSLAARLFNQLQSFPQEKIHIHTDKPYYISGEKIWFRAFLADAATHTPSSISRFVYVELINPLDSVVCLQKIREQDGAYYGYLPIPDDVPQGDYTLRAYTTFMRSMEPDYFFTKTIRIGDPQAKEVYVQTRFSFESDRRIQIHFQFSRPNTLEPVVPKEVKISINEGRAMTLKVDSDGLASVNFTLPANAPRRVALLELAVTNTPYRQYIYIPASDSDFDVTFYPEGGSLMLGASSKVCFKALKSNGQSIDISGQVFDQSGAIVAAFESSHLGMGSFMLSTEKGDSYYAVCQNKNGQAKRFDLPVALESGYALSVSQRKDILLVSVATPVESPQSEELYLMAHTRGNLHFVGLWDGEKGVMAFPKELFPSGVLHFILFNSRLNPVSERLVFVQHRDWAQVSYQPDRNDFAPRSLVKNQVILKDAKGCPITGSFSVAVNSNREVAQDTTTNILTQLLLTSDLRGNIHNPAYYFQNTPESEWALDLLMCCQGWRRYATSDWAQGRIIEPLWPVEIGAEISGTVKTVITGSPVSGVEVEAISVQTRSFSHGITDEEGRFYLPVDESPNKTSYVVSVEPKVGTRRMGLVLDQEDSPKFSLGIVPPLEVNTVQFAQYADKADQQYVQEGGLRVTLLQAAVVSADRIVPRRSEMYAPVSHTNTITQEKLNQWVSMDIYTILSQIAGVQIYDSFTEDGLIQKEIAIRGGSSIEGGTTPLLVINEVPMDIEYLDMINVQDIAQIDILKAGEGIVFGNAKNGVISIFTKNAADVSSVAFKPFHIKTISLLGYQRPVEFYAPKYDTPEKRASYKPDYRTTIHWQPLVKTDDAGVAYFEFYTSDDPISYTVTIEGLAPDGTLIQQQTRLWVQ